VQALVNAGKLRALAITSRERFAALPDVPTVSESGYRDFEVHNSYGVFAPVANTASMISKFNPAFNKALPLEGVSFSYTFATTEGMLPFKCDVHGWMCAYVGVLDHPYYGATAADGTVVLANLPPGTYTLEAWHEALGTRTQQVTIGAKESKDVSFSFAR